MFSKAFLDLDAGEIVEQVRHKGYYAAERALTEDAVGQILADVNNLQFEFNANTAPNVVHKGQTFANHVFARSQTAFDVAVHPRVTGVLREGLGNVFRMMGKRVYETRPGFYMQFHSDNGSPCVDPMQLDTIVFIFYLTDVYQGEWEIVEGSHLWGDARVGSQEQDAELINRPDTNVVGFKMPAGSLIIYNGRVLHRARQYTDPNFARQSFFFQVNRTSTPGEPMLINAGFIKPDLSDDAKMLLGFGVPSTQPPFPSSSLKSLPIGSYPKLDAHLVENLPLERLVNIKAALSSARQAETLT